MTVPTHFRHVVRGKFLGSPEIWSYSVKFRRDVDTGPDATTDNISVSAVDSALATFVHDAPFSSSVEVADWRWYQIGTDGHMEGDAPLLREYTAGELKGVGSRTLPPQIATVVSTIGQHRGPGQFGRFYLPWSQVSINPADGRMSDTAAEAYLPLVVNYLKALSNAIDLPGVVDSAAMWNVSTKPAGTGSHQVVDHVRLGLALDTLRTRRNALAEDYQESGVIDW